MNPGREHPLTTEFQALRPRLVRIAYATLGSLAEAEDCVQEAWLRLQRIEDPETIRDLGAWLTTTVGRLALDALGSARARREHYVGPWLPEPLVQDLSGDPAEQAEIAETVSTALLIVLERLSGAERVAFILHDVFGMPFEDIGHVVGKSTEAVRQLAARARRNVQAHQPRFPPTRAQQHQLVTAFAAACQHGDIDRLVTLLDPDVVWRTDSGGKVAAAYQEIAGARQVAAALLQFSREQPEAIRIANVNGTAGLVLRDNQGILSVIAFTVNNGRITAIDAVRNPDKLASTL